MEQLKYYTGDLDIMPGFYESDLWNYDLESMHSEICEEKREIKDFQAYKNYIGKEMTKTLTDWLKPFCDSVGFDSISSPREYNFTTDKLVINLNIDLDKLKAWVSEDKERYDGFDAYLKANYTSRSGFSSFVRNNAKDFLEENDYMDVLVDYYLLTKIYDSNNVLDKDIYNTDYYEWLIEIRNEALDIYCLPIEEEKDTIVS